MASHRFTRIGTNGYEGDGLSHAETQRAQRVKSLCGIVERDDATRGRAPLRRTDGAGRRSEFALEGSGNGAMADESADREAVRASTRSDL